jgi:hypothetical protein
MTETDEKEKIIFIFISDYRPIYTPPTDRVSVAVKLLLREVLGLNLGRDTGCYD